MDEFYWLGVLVSVFAERHRVVAFDNREAGQTDAPDHP
jgi:hypothetical protein